MSIGNGLFLATRCGLAAGLLALAGPAAAQTPPGLSGQERRVVEAARADHDRAVALLERVVEINSGTLNVAGVDKVAEVYRREFEALGFTVQHLPPATAGRAGHLLAERRGRAGAPRVLMIAHLDTVFEADSPFQRFERHGDTAVGPGVNDIKGGVVVILTALRALKTAGALDPANLTVVLTGDEEKPGRPVSVARAALVAAGKRSDLALDFEAEARIDGHDAASIARRSASGWTVTTTGKTGHSSGVGKGAGFGAVYELARIIDAFRRALPEPNLTYNTALIAGGATAGLDETTTHATASGKDNIIAAQAVASGDLRALSNAQIARVQAKMRAIVAAHLPGADAQIAFAEDGYPAMAPTPASQALFDELNLITRDMGRPPMVEGDPAGRGAGDISFVAEDVPGLVGLGVAGEGAHAVGESADLASLDVQAARAGLLVLRLTRDGLAKRR